MILSYLRLAWKALFRKRLYTLVSLFGITFTLSTLFAGTAVYDYLMKPNYPEYKQDRILVFDQIRIFGKTNGGSYSSASGLGYVFIKKSLLTMNTPQKIGLSTKYGERTVFMDKHKFVFTIWEADAAYWEIFDFECVEGKLFSQAEITNKAKVAVISESTARKYFGRNSPAAGKKISIDNDSYLVTGVVKDVPKTREVTYGDIWIPLLLPPGDFGYLMGPYTAYLLASSESTVGAVRKELAQKISSIRFSDYIDSNERKISDIIPTIETPAEKLFMNNFRPERNFIPSGRFEKINISESTFYLIMVLVVILLMVFPAINLINIQIARYVGRASEIGIRRSYGAKKHIILRQLLTENLVITAIGSFLAVIVTFGLLKLLEASDLMPGARFIINYRILAWGVAFVLLFNLISGIVPAWKISRLKIIQSLKGGEL